MLVFAGEKPKVIPNPVSDKLFFEENKNQWPSQVYYQVEIPGGSLFLEKNLFTFHLVENVDFHGFVRKSKDSVTVHHHSYKVKFENSNPAVQISGTDKYSFVRNYYRGSDPEKWADNVSVYEGVKYQNIYSGIDIHIYNSDKHLKYDFIVNPGADYKNIKMDYDGPDEMRIDYGHLYIKTSVGVILEQKPYAYQEINGNKTEVACKYVLEGNKLSFAIRGNYNRSLPLVIDPTLVAATYTGSTADNWGFTATYDLSGNIYTGGIAASNGYPTTVGAFQTTFGGGGFGGIGFPFDISLSKLNPTGTALLFSTYYGGSDNEQPHSMFVNNNNELFVVGRTYSANFPATSGAYDQSFNGGADIILGKFNSTGGLLASTFLGGSADDCVNYDANAYGGTKYNYADDGRSEIMLDNASNVYVAACTQSANFPTTAGAYDATLAGTQDGCVFKMNSTLTSLMFSTYLGGTGDDAAYGLKIGNNQDIYVTGGTTSNNFPATAGVLHPTYMGGQADGFISVFNNTGTTLLRSTFMGTSAFDQSYFIEYDSGNNIYVFGLTTGAYPATAGVYTNPNSAQFIHKLDAALSTTLFSTVVGTGSLAPNISPTAFLVDSCESIYIAGWGRCQAFGTPNSNTVTGMPITANAQQSSTDGCDFYFMVLTPNAKSLWYGTFYGENTMTEPDHVDGGTSRFDRRAFIYQSVCASCGNNNAFPTMPGSLSTNNNSSNCNNAIIKMDVSVHPIAKANLTGPNTGCAPFTVPFNTTGSAASDFIWNFGDGSPSDTALNISHTYTAVGTYTVTLYAMDSLGVCAYIDSSKLVITVGLPPTLQMAQVDNKCFGDNTGTATVTATGGFIPYSYLWTANSQTTVSATGLVASTYTVQVTDSVGCKSTQTVTITEPTPVVGSVINSTNVSCRGGNDGSAAASATGGTGTITYSWNTTPAQPGPLSTNLSAGTYLVTMTDSNGCFITDSVLITEPPGMTLTSATTPCGCGVTNGTASVSSSGGLAPYTYLWLTNPVQTSAFISGLGVGSYSVIITDSKGCLEVNMVTINGVPPPQADFYYSPEFVSYLDPVVAFYDVSAGDPYYWSWNFGDPTSGSGNSSLYQHPTHTYSDTGYYCITLIVYDSSRVCVDTAVKCMKIEPDFTFYIPNAFTPNHNGINEIFYGYGTYIKEFEIMIFDRWGNLIFESNDILKGWDGKAQGGKSGEPVQEDVYVWKVKIIDVRDFPHNYIGHVNVVR